MAKRKKKQKKVVAKTDGQRRMDEKYVSPLRIGIVVHRNILPQTMSSCWAVSRMVEGGADLDIHALAYVDIGRNQIAVKALKAGNKYLLFVDFDMDFQPETVAALKNALDKDPKIGAIAAHYIKWDGSREAMAHWKTGVEIEGKSEGRWVTPEERDKRVAKHIQKREIAEVDRFGTGCMLVRTEVLKDIPYPWFQLWFHPEWGHVGEDVHFCWELKKAGYKPSCHFGAPAGHIGPTLWMPTEDGKGMPALRETDGTQTQEKKDGDKQLPGGPSGLTHPMSDQIGGS
jgi:hypothetical protein